MRLSAFAGAWAVERAIEDARAGRSGRFAGRAVFTAAAGGLRYREDGWLTLGAGPAMAAGRGYFWREGAGGAIEVWFEDGRFFHAFHPGAAAEAAHDCAPDRYLGRYDFSAWPAWSVAWRVSGPRKDYAMVTRFRPEGA